MLNSPPNRPNAWLLDLTRLVSRVGRGPMTGIDRVEDAYLTQLLSEKTQLFALVRTSLGYVLLNRVGIGNLHARLTGKTEWGAPDLLSRLFLKSNPQKRRVESDLRRICSARAGRGGLARMFTHLPDGTFWLNVGHTNLEPHVFDALHTVPKARAHVLVHDMIPLDHPDYQRDGTVEIFERRMKTVSNKADLIIFNSAQSQQDAERYFCEWGRVPNGIVAHLGVDRPVPDSSAVPQGLDLASPYFVTLGTIEPRKNHALLLDIWAELAKEGEPPPLFIIGNRGWKNDAIFARLDTHPTGIHELNGLNDAAMAALVQGAHAALFPSLAEGFGLPPCEAVLLGTKVVAHDLPVTREILNNIPIYANASDMYSWLKIIREIAGKEKVRQKAVTLPTWQDHFNTVLKVS